MNPKKIITAEQLYQVDIWMCGMADYNYRYSSYLAKACRRNKPQIRSLGDLLKLSPTDIQNIKGIGPVTYENFIAFLVKHPHLVCIPGFPYNHELRDLVLSKVTTAESFVVTAQQPSSDIVINENPVPIAEELKLFSALVAFDCGCGIAVYIVKATSKIDAGFIVRNKLDDHRIRQVVIEELDIKNNDLIQIFDKL